MAFFQHLMLIGKISDKVFFYNSEMALLSMLKLFVPLELHLEILKACCVCVKFRFLIGPKIPSFVHHNNQPIKCLLKLKVAQWKNGFIKDLTI